MLTEEQYAYDEIMSEARMDDYWKEDSEDEPEPTVLEQIINHN